MLVMSNTKGFSFEYIDDGETRTFIPGKNKNMYIDLKAIRSVDYEKGAIMDNSSSSFFDKIFRVLIGKKWIIKYSELTVTYNYGRRRPETFKLDPSTSDDIYDALMKALNS